MRDRVFINKSNRERIGEWGDSNVLGINMMENKDLYLLAVALGLQSPEEIQGPKEGYVRTAYFKTTDKSLLASILLGKVKNEDEIDLVANYDVSYDESEKCAEAGFNMLAEIINSANGNKDLMEKRLMKQLGELYQINVAPNL